MATVPPPPKETRMRPSTVTLSHAPALALALLAPAAGADTLIDNLAQPVRDTTVVESTLWAAQSFSSPQAVRIDAITLPLGLQTGPAAGVAELRADAGGLPGAWLATFTLPALGAGAPAPLSLGVPAGLELAPDTLVWLVLGTAPGSTLGWSYANNNLWAGSGSLGNYAYSNDGGGSWANFGSDFPYQVQIDVSPVPEPSAALLLATGAAALAWRRRRRA